MTNPVKRVLVCGDREWDKADVIRRALARFGPKIVVIHGACRGADRLAGAVAVSLGYEVESYPADWKRFGKGAGPKRNQEMLESGVDVVLAFHDHIDKSRGTKDMLARAIASGVVTMLVTSTEAQL